MQMERITNLRVLMTTGILIAAAAYRQINYKCFLKKYQSFVHGIKYYMKQIYCIEAVIKFIIIFF